ncbi:MAG: hypothetical protein PHQ34_06540 [Methanothrix sp.]|nr:hypothetical protein [Methanothrix sp.]
MRQRDEILRPQAPPGSRRRPSSGHTPPGGAGSWPSGARFESSKLD